MEKREKTCPQKTTSSDIKINLILTPERECNIGLKVQTTKDQNIIANSKKIMQEYS